MNADADFKVVAYEESAKQDEKTVLAQIATQARAKESTSLVAFFGPEGGIAPEEINSLRLQDINVPDLDRESYGQKPPRFIYSRRFPLLRSWSRIITKI